MKRQHLRSPEPRIDRTDRELPAPDAPPTSSTHKFVLGSSTRYVANAIEREEPDPIVGLIVFGDDESTQPHKVRADARQARGHRAMSSDSAGAAMWWRCAAMVAGLFVVLDLVFRVLGSGGGAR